MPTKRTPTAPTIPLTPAWRYALLTGEDPGVRLHGWVTQAQAGQYGEPTADDVWTQHREALIAEAHRHGFEPCRMTRKRPSGDGFTRWQAEFFAQHRY
jgi:hypothetical protein